MCVSLRCRRCCLSRRSWEAAVARIASSSTSHRFVVANMLPMSLLKTAQGHPMEDFCHPRSQVLTRSSFASDMDSGHSWMGIDSGECLNVIFEVTPSNISMSLMRSLIRCKKKQSSGQTAGLQLVVKGMVKVGGRGGR
ncbi:hypothetical protein CY35_10G040400 [Sphagnum magellanicum]|nr:hypothetical protein CY35_10G040400 [Sphagnum magellanicum]